MGDPDLQGIWVGSTLTPLERSPQFEGREFLTEEEIGAPESAAVARNVQLAERPSEATTAGWQRGLAEDGTPGFYNCWDKSGAGGDSGPRLAAGPDS